MTTVRAALTDIVKLVSGALRSGTFDAIFDAVVDRLEGLIDPATDREKDVARYLLGLMNLLLEIRRGSLPPAIAEPFLANILKSLDRPPAFANGLLQGEEAKAEVHPEVRIGCTMIRWSDFIRFYAPRYGKSRASSDLEKLWLRIERGELRAPREDLHLSGNSGIVWITDGEALHAQCRSPGSTEIDGTTAYDALGLDWTSGWTYAHATPEARAVVLEAPVSHRRTADRGLRVPTSIDAWGGATFVPKHAAPPCRWPSNAGMTVDPTCGSERLPEAVHGSMLVVSGADCPVLPCAPVRKAVTDRIDECGRAVCMKAARALRAT